MRLDPTLLYLALRRKKQVKKAPPIWEIIDGHFTMTR